MATTKVVPGVAHRQASGALAAVYNRAASLVSTLLKSHGGKVFGALYSTLRRGHHAVRALTIPAVVQMRGHVIHLDRTDALGLALRVREGRVYEAFTTEIIAELTPRGGFALDVGACIGYMALEMARAAGPGGCVVAYEPNPRNAALVRQNFDANGYLFGEVRQVAVSDVHGRMTFYEDARSAGQGGLFHRSGGGRSYEVDVVRLDDLFPTETIDLIKMDVEGAEAHALRGMERLARRCAGLTMICELNPEALREAGSDPAAFVEHLRRLFPYVYRIDDQAREIHRIASGEDALAALQASGRPYCNLMCTKEVREGVLAETHGV